MRDGLLKPDSKPECPSGGTLQAFNAGRLTKLERAAIVEHVVTCSSCSYIVFAAITRRRARSSFIRHGVAAVVVAALMLLGAARVFVASDRDVAARYYRVTGARITGMAWTPLRRGASRPERPALEFLRARTTLEARHDAARAALIAREPDEAVRLLTPVVETTRDATLWSDLAAAHIASAEKSGTAAPLAEALAAADAALELRPSLAAALFNRALTVHRLGLRDAARDAWRTYLQNAPPDEWAGEARSYLAAVSSPALAFEAAVQRYREARRADATAIADLVEAFPHDSRAYALTDVLALWAAGPPDAPQPSSFLAEAQAFGRVFATRGDFLIADHVALLDHVETSARQRLESAHSSFGEGRARMRAKQPTAAEASFRDALRNLDRGSAFELLVRRNLGTALYEQNRIGEAEREMEHILPLASRRHPSLRAEILWQLGLCRSARSQWGAAIRAFRESGELFDRVGEHYHAAIVRNILAQVYDTLGDARSGWELRTTVLRQLGRTTTVRTQTCLASVSRHAALEQRWRVAAAFLNLEIGISSEIQDPPSRADALLRRAVAHHFLGRGGDSLRDVAAAGEVIAGMADGAYRTRAATDRLAVEALLAVSPAETVRKLTEAIAFHRSGGRRMFLPTLHLRRGLALRAMGDRARAERDFAEGIAELEASRETLPDIVTRLGVLDFAEELFVEAIGAALQRGDPRAALAYSERSRARALLDAVLAGSQQLPDRDTYVVSYVALRERLVAFIVSGSSVVATPVRSSPAAAAEEVRRYLAALANDRYADADRISQTLYGDLVAPVLSSIPPKSRVVFVPEARLASLPFAALRAPKGRYLIEDHVVSKAPSIAVYLRLQQRRPPVPPESICLVAVGSSGAMEPLPGAAREARAIAGLYRRADLLSDGAATVSRFLMRAPRADVVHVAGHGTARGPASPVTALVLAGGERLVPERVQEMTLHRWPVVVLAACDTAGGETRWTEGTLSVARSFLAAGAASVVATLWPIDDAPAAEIFFALHTRLAHGGLTAEALRTTQLNWIRAGRSVREWAAVELIGG